MMDLWIRALSMLLGCGRMLLGIWVALSPAANFVAVLFGAFEALSGALAAINAGLALEVDRRIVGLLLPAVYMTGAYVVCSPGDSEAGLIVGLLVVWVLRMWALAWLGLGYSVGAATWLGLAERGPFAFVRHPMASTGVAARVVFVLANPEAWNFIALGVMVVAELASVWLEEGFLRQFDEWRGYAARVHWRLLPGVW